MSYKFSVTPPKERIFKADLFCLAKFYPENLSSVLI